MIAVTETDPGAGDGGPRVGPSGGREVVVPIRLYKTITVFSSIIAIAAILGGFILLDVATNRTQADPSEVNVALALLGVGLIAFGTVTYAFSTRFRTDGMGDADAGGKGGADTEGKGDVDAERMGDVDTERMRNADAEGKGEAYSEGLGNADTEGMGNAKDDEHERNYNNG